MEGRKQGSEEGCEPARDEAQGRRGSAEALVSPSPHLRRGQAERWREGSAFTEGKSGATEAMIFQTDSQRRAHIEAILLNVDVSKTRPRKGQKPSVIQRRAARRPEKVVGSTTSPRGSSG